MHFYFPSIEDVFTKQEEHTTAAQKMEEMRKSLQMQQYQDSLYADSLAFFTHFFQNHPSKIYLPNDNWDYFNDLFSSFEQCEKQNELIHILHYGDSQIEGDRITGYIRQKLQEKFGGEGPGLLPAVQPIPTSSVGQLASENIERYIISGALQNRIPHNRYGVLGQVGITQGESSFSAASRNWNNTFERVKEFQKIRLFVGRSSNHFQAELIAPNKKSWTGSIVEETSPVQVFSWESEAPLKKFTLRMRGAGEIYGVAVDGISGIAMSNVPFRGSSGTFFCDIDSAVMTSMMKELNVKLILLEFGGNMMPAIKTDKAISNYKQKMSEQIVCLEKWCPGVKIILIGPADMSTKVNGKLQTYPYLEKMIEALKEAALENDAAFWNMYEVMGGKNSMMDWVKNSPPWAAPDYIHFTSKGADRIGGLFYESFMLYYDYYRFVSEHKKVSANKKKMKSKTKSKY